MVQDVDETRQLGVRYIEVGYNKNVRKEIPYVTLTKRYQMKQVLEGIVAIAAIPAVIAVVINLNMCLHGC